MSIVARVASCSPHERSEYAGQSFPDFAALRPLIPGYVETAQVGQGAKRRAHAFAVLRSAWASLRSAHPTGARIALWINRFLWITGLRGLPLIMFLRICSYNPAHSRAPPEASESGAGCGVPRPVPRKHGPREVRDSPRGTTTLTRYVRYRDDSHAQRQCWKRAVSGSATPVTENRRAERRRAQRSLRQGDAHARQGVQRNTRGATRRSAPRLARATPALPRREHETATRGADRTAADFAWLFDIVNRTRER